MNKKVSIFISAVLLILIVAGVAWWQRGVHQDRGPLDKVAIQFKWLHQSQFAGFYVAAKEGFYADEGLDVALLPVGADLSEANVVERVSRGEIQFGVVGADRVVLARAENKPIKAISVIYQQSPVVLAASKKSGIKEMKDLVGKKMAVEKEQNTHTIYHAMMKKAGINETKVHETTAPYGLGALTDGTADARMIYLVNEGLEIGPSGGDFNIIYPDTFGLQIYADTLITSDSLISKNPDLVQRFVRASIKGWNWAVANPEEAGILALQYDGKLSATHEVDMMNASLPFIYTDKANIGSMEAATWEKMESILLEQKLIRSHIPVEELFTIKFL